MVIDVFSEEEKANASKKIYMEGEDNSEIQRIKSHLDVTYLKYVSDNVKHLLKLDINNDLECFKKNINLKINEKDGFYRVILYIRLSVEDGDVIDGDVSKSIRNQLLILLDECEKRGWTVVAIFCEDGISGANDDREEWNKSLKFCEYRNTEIFLSKSQSRFSRSMEMIEKYLHNEFVKWNIRFVGLVDSTDTSIAGNKKTRQINGLVNEWQVEDQSINIRTVLKNKKSNGLFTGSFAPYGYMKDPKDKYHLVIDKEAGEVVKKIFSMYASGKGALKICKYLNDNKIPIPSVYKHEKGLKYKSCNFECDKRITYQVEAEDTLLSIADRYQSTIEDIMEYNSLKNENIKEGQIIVVPVIHKWKSQRIYNILKNEVYIGTLIQHKNEVISYKNKKQRLVPEEERIVVPHCHKPIIDKETWDIVSSRFDKFKNEKANRKIKSGANYEISIFSGKLRCDCCGHSFHKNISTYREKRYIYWGCRSRSSTALALCSNDKVVNEKDIYELVLNEINKQIEKYYDKVLIEKNYYKQKVDKSLENEIKSLVKEKTQLEDSISKKENAITLLYDDRVNGIISVEEFTMIKNKNSFDINNYKLRINKIEEEIDNLKIRKEKKVNTENILRKYNKIEKLNRQIIDEFISKINIGYYNTETKTRKIKIDWNIVSE